jgi:hypothetical protein
MITVGLAPGCPAAAHRLLAVGVAKRALEPLSWSPLAMTLALAVPVALVALASLGVWRRKLSRSAPFLLILAYALHPPSVLPLAPLLFSRDLLRAMRGRALLAAGLLLAIAIWAVTPDCSAIDRPDLATIARELAVFLLNAIGPLVGLLIVLELFDQWRSREVRYALGIVVLDVVAVFLLPAFDRRITVVPAVVAFWWLAFRAALRVAGDASSRLAWVAAVLVLAIVPVLEATRVTANAPQRTLRTSWTRLRRALDPLPRPAAFLTTDASLTPWIAAWRSGLADGAGALELVAPDSSWLGRTVQSRPVFAFGADVDRLSRQGLLLTREAGSERTPETEIWRVVDYAPCAQMGASWTDVSDLATSGQISVRVSDSAVRAVVILYSAFQGPTWTSELVRLQNGGPVALSGTRLEQWDLTRSDDRERLRMAAQSDGIDLASWGNDSAVVLRVEVERGTGDKLPTLSFGAQPGHVAAHLAAPVRWPYAVAACRSTVSQVVVGYADAPRTASFDMLGRAWIRHGWHDPEKEGDVAFRWTSEARAEARFFAVRPEPLLVTLGLMPIAGSAHEQLRVSMNGRPLLRDATDADTWQVPAATLHAGDNTLTLEAPVVTGPPGDRRRLGLKVSSIVLRRTASF